MSEQQQDITPPKYTQEEIEESRFEEEARVSQAMIHYLTERGIGLGVEIRRLMRRVSELEAEVESLRPASEETVPGEVVAEPKA